MSPNQKDPINECTNPPSLHENMAENREKIQILNSKMRSTITLLANKLWIYASEKKMWECGSHAQWTVWVSDEDNVMSLVFSQKDSLHYYSNLLDDLNEIVDQI